MNCARCIDQSQLRKFLLVQNSISSLGQCASGVVQERLGNGRGVVSPVLHIDMEIFDHINQYQRGPRLFAMRAASSAARMAMELLSIASMTLEYILFPSREGRKSCTLFELVN